MSYESMTVGDPNLIKRAIHRNRYARATRKMNLSGSGADILDFGAGSGELARYILGKNPDARITLFEPATKYSDEIKQNVAKHGSSVRVVGHFEDIENDSFSHIFCLSVFEHLPPTELKEALERLHHVSTTETPTLVEVPNELYVAAAVKGLFRHGRRPEAFDGRVSNILQAVAGRPPSERPISNFDPGSTIGLPWHGSHLGFNYHNLEKAMVESNLFHIEGPSFAPLNFLGAVASLDVYYSLTPNN